MGAIAVLQPNDCMNQRSATKYGRRIPNTNPKPNPYRKSNNPNPRSERRRRNLPRRNEDSDNENTPTAAAVKNLVMGQVKILKRGEALNVLDCEKNSLAKDEEVKTTVSKDVSKFKFESKVDVDLVSDGDLGLLTTEQTVDVGLVDDGDLGLSVTEQIVDMDLVDDGDLGLCTTDRFGPEAPNLPDFYAGFAFVDSPSPSSLPVPAFFTQKSDPTMGLLRLLGLNLS